MDSRALLAERDHKQAILNEKEIRVTTLTEDLERLQDKDQQVRFIEHELAAHYAEQQKTHFVDRTQEEEIEKTVKEKKAEANKAAGIYDRAVSNVSRQKRNVMSAAERDRQNAVKDAEERKGVRITTRTDWNQTFYEKYQDYDWDDKYDAMRNLEARYEKFKLTNYEKEVKAAQKAYDDASKAADKGYADTVKEAGKKYLDVIKQLLGELDIDMARFNKKGLSKQNLDLLVDTMSNIYKSGVKVGTVPTSYQQKLYKWQLLAKELPEDKEKADRADEVKAEKELKRRLSKLQKELDEEKKKLEDGARKQIQDEELLIQDKAELGRLLNYRDSDQIKNYAEDKRQQISFVYSDNVRRINERYEAGVNNKRSALAQLEKQRLTCVSELEKIKNDREVAEKELASSFALAFGKKRAIKEKIAEISTAVEQKGKELQQLQNRIDSTNNISPESDRDSALKSAKETMTDALERVDIEVHTRVDRLDRDISELRKKITVAESSIARQGEAMETTKVSIQNTEKEIEEIKPTLEDFHTYYMLKTYGKELGINADISEKKRELKGLTAEVKALKKELASLDKECVAAEKELAEAQARKAQEAERIRKEQEERRARIEAELRQRDAEQVIIREKANKAVDIAGTVRAFRQDPSHPLLASSSMPFEDDGKRVITNSIVRKTFRRVRAGSGCERYALFFVDPDGTAISEQRLIEEMAIGETTTTSFELKAVNGFTADCYYLLVTDFNTGEILGAQQYKINISFANDFDF